ncbi:hypothetical protein MYCTH_94026 [Thermothelomyces thermophilus ATCC 42464]|uniref:Uncharacterized protein n=1 Tax=Thermothelomyces thermophilus (strain ATCC 42464 / BCRC 31852 / DSM 1799) TaxID=573729 RepID=G2QEG4_THET4|nr:uncharacterized protein MYCTH_94026 [Thermothelomyces thermophilus ATCC 42464]AEO57747.1 hypothetical protein MYCTH_94026 [Thermothelomyces thermophilus ATCC 42464]
MQASRAELKQRALPHRAFWARHPIPPAYELLVVTLPSWSPDWLGWGRALLAQVDQITTCSTPDSPGSLDLPSLWSHGPTLPSRGDMGTGRNGAFLQHFPANKGARQLQGEVRAEAMGRSYNAARVAAVGFGKDDASTELSVDGSVWTAYCTPARGINVVTPYRPRLPPVLMTGPGFVSYGLIDSHTTRKRSTRWLVYSVCTEEKLGQPPKHRRGAKVGVQTDPRAPVYCLPHPLFGACPYLLVRIEFCALIAARHVPPPGDSGLIRGHNTSASGNVLGRRIDPQSASARLWATSSGLIEHFQLGHTAAATVELPVERFRTYLTYCNTLAR